MASVAALVLAVSIGVIPAAAQGPMHASLRAGITRPSLSDTLAPRFVPAGHGGRRAVLSVVGAAVGAVGGAALAMRVLPRSRCGDDPGLCEALQGIAVGSVLGAGLGAALPRGTGGCEFRRLVPRALASATFGYALGAVVGTPLTGTPLLGIAVVGPAGAAVGGAVGARRCRTRSRASADLRVSGTP